jgi:hypothetical protein
MNDINVKISSVKLILLAVIPLITCIMGNAQSLATGQEVRFNPIYTATPFLTITPDSRHGAMGDAGAATSADANSQYWNSSKYPFINDQYGISLSYTPWLRQLTGDINLAYLAGYFKLDGLQTIGSSLRYFSMGDIRQTDLNGTYTSTANPNEFALDLSYSRKLSEVFSGGVAIRYIRSDLSNGSAGTLTGAGTYSAGNAFATDVSFYYQNKLGGDESRNSIAAGVNFSNIGSKISYNQGSTKEFLPANMKLGTTFITQMTDSSSLSFSLDLNKLLVPTPSNIVTTKSDGSVILTPDNNSGKSVISSIFGSFTDAPGGYKEELQEVTVSLGAEYWYRKIFAIRGGYFNESQNKGNRKYFSAGVGVKIKTCNIDLSYLVPVQQNNPLANTIRVTVLFNLNRILKSSGSQEPHGDPNRVK